jgi:hypothetical protein
MVANSGNVGIGTTSPWAQLSVNYSKYTNGSVFAIGSTTAAGVESTLFSVDNTGLTTIGDSSGTGDANFQFGNDPNAWSVGYKSSDKSFSIASSTNFSGTSQFSLAKNGNLTIVGSAVTCIIGNGSSATSCSSSDARLKSNIAPLEDLDGLAAIEALKPVSYNWNTWMQSNGSASTTQFGFIAQDVQNVFPNLVTQDVNTGFYKLDYQGFFSPMVKAIQELHLDLATIASTTASSTPMSQSFAMSFFGNIFSRVTTWFADASNGIGDFFANRVHTKELCVGDSGIETCITKTKLDALLAGAATPAVTATNSPVLSASKAPAHIASSTTALIGNNSTANATSSTSTVNMIHLVAATSTAPVITFITTSTSTTPTPVIASTTSATIPVVVAPATTTVQ